jgi:aspartate aminotransferase
MNRISKRMALLGESQTVALNSTLARLKREGRDVVALGAGEPDFDTPEHIKEAAKRAIENGFTKYTPAEGTMELREAIGAWIREEYGADYKPNQIVVTCGAKFAVFQAILALCDPGDEVILPRPYWVSYPEQIKLADADIRYLDPDSPDGLKITARGLRAAINAKTRLLILNSPSNPSGAVYSHEELAALVEVIHDSGIHVLADEIYDKIVFDGLKFTSLCQFESIRDQVILVNGVSKSFAMTGWRIGWLAAEAAIAEAVKKYQGHSTSNPTSISQKAALAAMVGSKQFIAEMHQAFTQRRNYVHERLNAMPGVRCQLPQGAFYAFPDVSACYGRALDGFTVNDSISFCDYLLQRHNVAIVPGCAFGMDSRVRLSYATSMEQLKKALDRIEAGIQGLMA